MSKTKQELIKEVKEIEQFAITIAVFFVAFIYSVIKASGGSDAQSGKTLVFGLGVAVHIVNYFLVEIGQRDISKGWFYWVKTSLIVGTLSFVVPIIVSGAYYDKPIPNAWRWPFMVSLYVSLIAPLGTFFLILFHLDYKSFFELMHIWKSRKHRVK